MYPSSRGPKKSSLQSFASRAENFRSLNRLLTQVERILEINAKSMIAGLVGWSVCAFFASVAFNWTFYYVLALAVAGREIVASRRHVPRREKNAMRAASLVRAPA